MRDEISVHDFRLLMLSALLAAALWINLATILNAPVSTTQVVEDVLLFDAGHVQHLVHDVRGCGHMDGAILIGRLRLLGACRIARRQNASDDQQAASQKARVHKPSLLPCRGERCSFQKRQESWRIYSGS